MAGGRPLAISAVLHAALFGSMIFYAAFFAGGSGASWGNSGDGTGGAMSATLVNNIPLPANPQAQPENVLANESKGVSQSVPKPEEKDKTAIPIPDRHAKTKTKIKPPKQPPVTPTREKPREIASVSNVVPFGQGGPVSGPYGQFSAAGAKGGFGFNGSGGDFGIALRMVRGCGSAQGIRELDEVRDRSEHIDHAASLHLF